MLHGQVCVCVWCVYCMSHRKWHATGGWFARSTAGGKVKVLGARACARVPCAKSSIARVHRSAVRCQPHNRKCRAVRVKRNCVARGEVWRQ